MSSDNGWVIRRNAEGKYVLQMYCASADDFPPIDSAAAVCDSLEEAVLEYNEYDRGDYPSEYGLTLQINERGKMNSETYTRKTFSVDAVQITEENIDEVAAWCQGDIATNDAGQKFIKVRVHNPLTERQTRGFVGDWVLYAGKGYKVYTDKAFKNSFDGPKEQQSTNVFEEAATS